MMPGDEAFTEKRIAFFLERLKALLYEEEIPLEAEYCVFRPMVPFEARLGGKYRPVKTGKAWGKNWDRAWFHLTGVVPDTWRGRPVCARIDLGGEGLIFDSEGTPVQGLSVHSIWAGYDFRRDRFRVCASAKGGERVDLWIEATAGQLFGLQLNNEKGWRVPDRFGDYEAAAGDMVLGVFRQDLWELWLECALLESQMRALPDHHVRRKRIRRSLNRIADQFTGDRRKTGSLRRSLEPLLKAEGGPSDLSTSAVGHAHLDTAWLWPVSETIQKCARTFSTQIALLKRYPEYVFGASAAQHYDFVKKYYPSLYRQIREMVRLNRWEVQGGMWVEADCNLIGGESLVRQILYGKRFFMDEMGLDVRNLWLPDVFGYPASLPQIIRKGGMESFVTQKLSWNRVNRFPYHTFRWRGIDGSEIIAHFPPENDYNSPLMPEGLIKARDRFSEGDYLDRFLTLFGVGDGGGGPTEEMIETGLRLKNMEGCPGVSFQAARDFLDTLGAHRESLPLWTGELYFEMHRGTYTSQARNKRMNRTMELKLRAVELVCSALPLGSWPTDTLAQIWKELLLLQFHDILPGSSVTPVYRESGESYKAMEKKADRLLKEAGENLFPAKRNRICLVNTLSFSHRRPVLLPASWKGHTVLDGKDRRLEQQQEPDGPVVLADIPPLSAVTWRKGPPAEIRANRPVKNPLVLDNDRIRYTFSQQGTLTEAYDREAERAVMAPGQEGNLLVLYEDRPVEWDAWDIDIEYEQQVRDRARMADYKALTRGPVRQGLEFHFRIGRSEIVQKVRLAAGSKCLDFETRVEWKEIHRLLRVGFDVDLACDRAGYEIQYGVVYRNTHRNTSWDWARFESVGHRFADLSQPEYGAALLNDCKYGYKILENRLSLSLLRAPASPDPVADRGTHRFTYSFLPHTGDLAHSDVLEEAARLNQEVLCFPGRESGSRIFPFQLDTDRIVLDCVKKAEMESVWILRLYEPYGCNRRICLTLPENVTGVHETDLLEREVRKLPVEGSRVILDFQPFEIKTLKAVPSSLSAGVS